MELFQKDGDTFAGRTIFHDFDQLFKGATRGVIMTEGDIWRDKRRFALHMFRDFGVGKNLMQERILTEDSSLLERIELDGEMGCDGVDIAKHIDLAVGS